MQSATLLGWGSAAFGELGALAVRSAALLALGLLGTALLRRAAPQARQTLWASVIVGVLVLPPLTAVLPAWRVLPPVPWLESPPVSALTFAADETSARPSSGGERARDVGGVSWAASPVVSPGGARAGWRGLLAVSWVAGSALVVLSFGLGLLRLGAIRRRGRPAGPALTAEGARHARALGLRRRVRVLTAEGIGSPATWGLFRPVIVLPPVAAGWSAERQSLVLAHEMIHVARRDFGWRLLAQLGCIAYWFNPLAWVAARQLRREQELACDLAVVAGGARPSTYAHHLLSIARAASGRPLPLVALDMARRSQMEGRLMSILENRPARSPRRALLLPALLVLLVLPVLASAGTRLASAPEAPDAVGSTPSAVVPALAAAPLPVLAAATPAPPVAPPSAIAQVEPALAPVAPQEPSARPEMEIDPESRRLEEEIARRAEEIAALMEPFHEEIARAMEEQIQPIIERMELEQFEMQPFQEEMSRIGDELSEVLESELEMEGEAEELQHKAEALALEAQERARLGEALVGAQGAERERIERALREAEESLAPLREELEVLRVGMAERHRASAEVIRARLEPYQARMEALRERMLPSQERLEQLRAELEPIQQRLEWAREERALEIGERLETLHQELDALRRERDARRDSGDSG